MHHKILKRSHHVNNLLRSCCHAIGDKRKGADAPGNVIPNPDKDIANALHTTYSI